MSLKDWKKVQTNVWRKDKRIIQIVRTWQKSTPQQYNVAIYPEGVANGYTHLESLENKSQALSFAKQYMRTH